MGIHLIPQVHNNLDRQQLVQNHFPRKFLWAYFLKKEVKTKPKVQNRNTNQSFEILAHGPPIKIIVFQRYYRQFTNVSLVNLRRVSLKNKRILLPIIEFTVPKYSLTFTCYDGKTKDKLYCMIFKKESKERKTNCRTKRKRKKGMVADTLVLWTHTFIER